jgi:hypothetical protein
MFWLFEEAKARNSILNPQKLKQSQGYEIELSISTG